MDVYKTSYVRSQSIASVHMNKRAVTSNVELVASRWPLARHTWAHIYRYTMDQYSYTLHILVPWWLVLLAECRTVSLAICNSIFHIINSPARCFSTWWDAIHAAPLSNNPPPPHSYSWRSPPPTFMWSGKRIVSLSIYLFLHLAPFQFCLLQFSYFIFRCVHVIYAHIYHKKTSCFCAE